jgi:hypothetical protein
MALIKTLEEIQEVLPRLVSTLSDFNNLPNFERAEEKYLVPIIGRTMYETLTEHYDAETLDADELAVVKKARVLIAAHAFCDELSLNNVTLTDTGPRKFAQSGAERVFNWEYQELKNGLVKSAYDGMEVLLSYLFDNKDLFPEWTDSDQFKRIDALLIRSGTEFSEHYTLFQPQRTFFIMQLDLERMQLLFINEGVGKDLITYLKTVAEPSDDEKESLKHLKTALAFKTIAQAAKHFSVAFTPAGFSISGEVNTSTNEYTLDEEKDIALLDMKIRECERQADDFLELSRNSLVALRAKDGATEDFKEAFDKGPLTAYVQPDDRTTGNESRNFYVFD